MALGQCDQMTSLFFQHFPIYNSETLPNSILHNKVAKAGLIFCQK